MIRSFRDTETEALYRNGKSKRFQSVESVAIRKLRMIDAALSTADLSALPGNRFQALKGDRDGQYSIRINDQYRVCFEWRDDGASG